MRLRNSVSAAAGALLIALSVPTSAHAATGEFTYKTLLGVAHVIPDPPSHECINVPGVSELLAAHAPNNSTNRAATVFRELDCGGDNYHVLQPGEQLGNLVRFRSVVFS
ncbi:hypothetical protein [Streptomyces sp. NPDC029003]|uniref:hypothetical protein n=1 Tax=Streptomyces sp. NPDC029003 TaxID=3155125 RepID=UPI00340CA523